MITDNLSFTWNNISSFENIRKKLETIVGPAQVNNYLEQVFSYNPFDSTLNNCIINYALQYSEKISPEQLRDQFLSRVNQFLYNLTRIQTVPNLTQFKNGLVNCFVSTMEENNPKIIESYESQIAREQAKKLNPSWNPKDPIPGYAGRAGHGRTLNNIGLLLNSPELVFSTGSTNN